MSTPPRFEIDQPTARRFAGEWFAGRLGDLDRLLTVFDHAGVERRRFCVPLEWFAEPTTFEQKNELFQRCADELAADAVRRLLDAHDLAPRDIDHLVFATSTGLSTPTLDARLIGRLGLRRDVLRTPVFGLGCAGGALGLVLASELLRGRPHDLLVLVNVELCGLTFQHDDFSKSNLVATALFGDGASAALLAGGARDVGGFEVRACGTHLWPDTLDVMGWNFRNHGMQVVFSSRIPALVRAEMAACIDGFLATHGVSRAAIDAWLVHPGGAKVLEAYADALGLPDRALTASRAVLRERGNCSAVTVMLVLERFLERGASAGDRALVTALGPGFSAGTLLLERV